MAILTSTDLLMPECIPLEIQFGSESTVVTLQHTRDSAERDRVVEALQQSDWNVSAAARLLGIERTNLHKRMRALGVSRAR
jgi:two-component system nitrogen regulation response regulator NtrX